MNTGWEDFWWNHITGPHMIVSEVTTALLHNKMVILRVPSDLPWRHAMRSAMYTAFQERSDFRDVVVEPIDILDDNLKNLEPGRFILDRFNDKGYRAHSQNSIQAYISSKNLIKNRIFWVKGLDQKSAEQWIKFCREFPQRSATEGLFVLEVHGNLPVTKINPLKLVDFSEYVSSYDVQLFNSFVLDEQDCYSDSWKKYISTCAASVCNIDAEISELILRIVDFKKESIIEGIKRISEMPDFSRRGEGNSSNHILWNYRHGKVSELEHRIWAAQIQVLFPIIELERVELIRKYEIEIQKTLANEPIVQYGEILCNAIDVELGTLCYLMSKRNKDGFYSLYIPNETDRTQIKFLHDCRNKLAHVSCCMPQEVQKLLG